MKFSIKEVLLKRSKKILKGLLITLGVILVLLSGLILFRNVIIKSGLKGTMEASFKAKCDITKVNLNIFKSKLNIDGIYQANKDEPMTNLFEIGNIEVDLKVSKLLQGSVYIENIQVKDIKEGTERTTNGSLPIKQKKEKEKKNKTNSKASKLQAKCKAALEKEFEKFNPQNLLNDLESQMESPKVGKEIYEDTKLIVEKWEKTAENYEKSITDLSSNINKVISTDYSKLNDISKIQDQVNLINKTISETDKLIKEVQETQDAFNQDTKKVGEYNTRLTTSINKDRVLLQSKINDVRNTFSVDGFNKIMNDTIESLLYSVFDNYAPYIQKLLNSINTKKTKTTPKADNTPQKTKKTKNSTSPKLYIANIDANGLHKNTNKAFFTLKALNISTDHNLTGEPSIIDVSFVAKGNNNKINLLVDSRDSSSHLVEGKYNGGGFYLEEDLEVFKLKGNSTLNTSFNADKSKDYGLKGTLNINVSDIEGMEFEPEIISKMYNASLKEIKSLPLNFEIQKQGEDIKVNILNINEAVALITRPFKKKVDGELDNICKDASNSVNSLLKGNTEDATKNLNKLGDIKKKLSKDKDEINKMKSLLNNKKDEGVNYTKKQAEEAVNEVKDQVIDEVKESANKLFKSFGF